MHSDIFFITYDEPLADLSWQRLQQAIPHAQRVHGVKGFDAAYKACAAQSRTERFFTIDGDNELLPEFFLMSLGSETFPAGSVLSWSAKNSVNGLCYGNGGIKNWPRDLVLKMKTHERSDTGTNSVDFCFQLNYFQMPGPLTIARVNDTAYQAFRAGFREGVKMCLENGEKTDFRANLKAHVRNENLNRLRIWCSVGADEPHGLWAIYGARLGCKMLTLTDWNHEVIRDYDWFHSFWQEKISALSESDLPASLADLEQELNAELGLGILTLDEKNSHFFKSVYVNPVRQGLMFR